MRIYLDNCCYNRPFDDQRQERIHMESEAVFAVLRRGIQQIDEIIGSSVLELEIDGTFDIYSTNIRTEYFKHAV